MICTSVVSYKPCLLMSPVVFKWKDISH